MTRQLDTLVILALTLGILPLLPGPASALDLRSWDQQIDNGRSRFQVLRSFNNEAVLDKETQLVWEQSPTNTGSFTWSAARNLCANKIVGGRNGWRLPSFHELASLVEPNHLGGGPFLPPGHPFANVLSADHWSATTVVDNPLAAWIVGFNDGFVGVSDKTNDHFVWCVRGGIPGPDVY